MAALQGEVTMATPRAVLIVEDSASDAQLIVRLLKKAYPEVTCHVVETAPEMRAALDRQPWDVVISDYRLPQFDGSAALKLLQDTGLDIPFIAVSGTMGEDTAVAMMKAGAHDYLMKGNLARLVPAVERELREVDARHGRRRAEDALRASGARHRTILETAMDGFWLVDMQGRLLEVNETYCRMSGYSAQELLAMRVADLEDAEEANETATHIQKVIKDGEDRFESRHRRKDGGLCDVEVSVQYRPAEDGRFVVFLRDITERRLADEALTHSHHLMRYVIEHNRSAIAVHDRDLRYVYVSQRYLDDYKVQERDVIGKHHYDVFPDLPQKWRDVHQRALAGEISSAEDDSYVRDDGSVEWTRWECRPWYEANGSVGGIIIYTDVITERKRAEEEKFKLEGQLQQAQKMESVGRLAGGVAHDFNNMLSVILGHTELAINQVDVAHPLCAHLEEIRQAANRSADLTRQLLAFARKQTIAPKVLDLNDTVEGMLKMLQRLIGEDVRLAWLPGQDLWPVNVDPSQIDQILANLCVNARDAIAGVGKMTIETTNATFDEAYCALRAGSVPGEYVKLTVSDDGCGMDKETLSHLFEPFFTTKDIGKGTGLGLATVYGIVKQNSGFINVYSEAGHGTTLTIALPRHVGANAQAPADGTVEPAVRGHETILLVEDEPAILNLTTTMLERQGYTVLAAHTPGEAIHLAREYVGEIHLLMTDVVMPEMNGRELARNLLSLYPHLARLFMSGYTSDVIAHHGVLDEGVQFIQKPFSIQDLAAKVRNALGRPGGADS